MNKFVEKYGQILLPLITPYDANEDVDYDKYAELIEYLIQNDLCDSLIVTGTTGEASLLTFDERVKLMETAVKATWLPSPTSWASRTRPASTPPRSPTSSWPPPMWIPTSPSTTAMT